MILLADLLAATGGQVHGPVGPTAFESFCFDSRVIQPGQLFLAVKTERADGHDYIDDACEGGATGILCQHPVDMRMMGATCIVVPDTRQAIQDWARTILAKQQVEVIGITGSVGKTTAKEAIAAVLGALAPDSAVFKNQANYNGLYGLPIALGELRAEHRIAVLEMAADHLGEIGRLARIAPPDIAVVTTVEPAHLEAFGSLEAISREKGDLVAALRPAGLAVLNADDPRVLAMAERTSARVITFGTCPEYNPDCHPERVNNITAATTQRQRRVSSAAARSFAGISPQLNLSDQLAQDDVFTRRGPDDDSGMSTSPEKLSQKDHADTVASICPDVYATDILVSREGTSFTANTPAGGRKINIPLLGRHQVYAALAAIAVGLARGVALDTIAARLAGMSRVPGRLNPLPGRRGSLILDDSYSASPAAVEAALETLAALDARHRIAVLGDMLELGDYETTGHERVGRQAARVLDLLVTKGNRARSIADAARAAGMPADQVIVTYTPEDAARAVLERLAPGDVALVKGSLATRMEQIVRLLMDEPYLAPELLVRQDAAWQQIVTISPDRPTWLEVDLGAIAHNVSRLKQIADEAQLMISLKADAYGHGAIQVAQTALLNGATWLGVACFGEGVSLRQAGIQAPILVLGYTPAWQARDVVRHDLTATVFDLDVARAFSRAALALDRPARVHVKVDTGMGRLGVFPDQALAFIRTLRELPGLVVEGIFTHLSVADGTSDWERTYNAEQLAAFDRVLADLAAAGIRIPLTHAENSAALLQKDHPVSNDLRHSSFVTPHLSVGAGVRHSSLVRPGIAVYGLDPSPQVPCPPDFRPALAWKTQVAQVKELPPGSFVGYGATYRTSGCERIAVIPVGYADGFRRAPHHWGEVLVRGQRASITGRVCMDQTMINVTHISGIRQGDEVVLIGRQGDDRITAEEVAARLGTINYEVVSAILARVPRETLA
jgi:Alr-MurF fusion protein